MSVSCVSVIVSAEENADAQTEEAEDSSDSEGEADADSEKEGNPEIEEGYTTELEGCTKVVSWCKNGDNNIYGQFYYPADFDETKTYPVIIMSHGNWLYITAGRACKMAGKSSPGWICGLYI